MFKLIAAVRLRYGVTSVARSPQFRSMMLCIRWTTLILAAALLQLSCSSSKDEPTVIRFWGLGNEGEMVRQLIPEFERANPGIRVIVQQMPWTAAHEKLLTAFAGESTPDVSQLGNTWLPEFSVLNALEPLDPFVRQSRIVQVDDYFDGVLKMNRIDSSLFGIPWYVDTRVIYYRRDLLRQAGYTEPPTTWQEMLRLCEIMQRKAREEGRKQYPFFLPTNEWVPAIALGAQYGGDFLRDDNTRGNFSGPKFRKAFGLLASFYEKEYSPSGQQLITNLYNSFSDGLIAMYITGPWNIGEFGRRIAPRLQNEWMTAPLPSMDTTYPGVSLPLGTSLAIFRQSRHKEAAWKLVEFLASREQSIAFYRITGNLPPRKSAWEDSSLAHNPYIRAFYRQMQRLEPLPPVPEWEQIAIKLQLYVEYIATKTLTVDEALSRFDKEVDQMLAKRRWLVERRKQP
ncbi:MAG: sugar ABC transporter substrate-binding protein [Ignavibacteria bacterium]|nr:sugar ABC transporter substrate-binding protein [Ignavibacteria bacterium]